jgi:hypothetical protein
MLQKKNPSTTLVASSNKQLFSIGATGYVVQAPPPKMDSFRVEGYKVPDMEEYFNNIKEEIPHIKVQQTPPMYHHLKENLRKIIDSLIISDDRHPLKEAFNIYVFPTYEYVNEYLQPMIKGQVTTYYNTKTTDPVTGQQVDYFDPITGRNEYEDVEEKSPEHHALIRLFQTDPDEITALFIDVQTFLKEVRNLQLQFIDSFKVKQSEPRNYQGYIPITKDEHTILLELKQDMEMAITMAKASVQFVETFLIYHFTKLEDMNIDYFARKVNFGEFPRVLQHAYLILTYMRDLIVNDEDYIHATLRIDTDSMYKLFQVTTNTTLVIKPSTNYTDQLNPSYIEVLSDEESEEQPPPKQTPAPKKITYITIDDFETDSEEEQEQQKKKAKPPSPKYWEQNLGKRKSQKTNFYK